ANGLPNQTLPNLMVVFISLPIATMVYLSQFPEKKSRLTQALYTSLFMLIFIVFEYACIQFGAITYHNGWNFYWSIAFVVVMFLVIRIHYRRPLWAMILSVVLIMLLANIFDLSLDKMK